jgi:hypothetical protein
MKKPYFLITARCDRDGEFQVQRKEKTYASTKTLLDGTNRFPKTSVVCPTCRMWADIKNISEVK